MSTPPPPQNNGSNNNPGPPEPTQEDLVRDFWAHRIRVANAMNAFHPLSGMNGGMIPQATATLPNLALGGGAMAQQLPMNAPYYGRPFNNYNTYFQDQQLTNLNNTPNSYHIRPAAAEFLRLQQQAVQQSQARERSLHGQSMTPAMNYHAMPHTHTHAQIPTNHHGQNLEINNTNRNEGNSQPPSTQTLSKKITQKIQEKLNAAMAAQLFQEQDPQLSQQTQNQQQNVHIENQKITDLLHRLNGSAARGDGSVAMNVSNGTWQLPTVQCGGPLDSGERDMNTMNRQTAVAKRSSTVVESAKESTIAGPKDSTGAILTPATNDHVCDKAPSKIRPTLKKRRIEPTTQQISNKLDEIVDSLKDENIRSALQEDRDEIRTRRKEMQEYYEDQIKDMESRLSMYTKLECLAEEISEVRSESNSRAKNSRANNSTSHIEGSLDMIHLSLKNYRMLESNSDRLLGIDEKKN
eukprot:CAMPEP_0181111012 /NCGR_PEP_ID=MMETSP1071-20121207/19032_1 /TAXON_ID=35127 /ORGANISM="Thalassiosira sp., Strain NH16" /LENGTH=464 /DNA_ID=CAMNT_0023194845 /DNA_START=74 /DNA_END=1467 /DNA_ORIENTATION=+